MQEKPDPIIIQIASDVWSIIYVVFISALTGAVAYLNKIRQDWGSFKWHMLILSVVTGGMNGYFVYILCDIADLSWQATAIATGASGGAGWELLKYLIGRVESRVKTRP